MNTHASAIVSRRQAVTAAAAAALLITACPVWADEDASTDASTDAATAWNSAPPLVNTRTLAEESVTQIADEGQYTVIHFLLKSECPICLRHTHSYHQAESELPRIKNVFIKPDSIEEINGWLADASQDAPTIHQDPDARLAEFAGIPFGYRFRGQTVHYPALIVLNPAGEEVFRDVGKRTQDRYPLRLFKRKFSQLTRVDGHS